MYDTLVALALSGGIVVMWFLVQIAHLVIG